MVLPALAHEAPIALSPLPPAQGPCRTPMLPDHRRRALRVLLLENDAEDAWVVTRFLDRSERFDVTVTRCADAGEARAAVGAGAHDLWLFDIYLDRGTSLDFVAALRGIERGGPAPIVVLTGADSPAIEDAAFDSGAMTCLAKADATTGTLDSAISAALRRADAERRTRAEIVDLDARLRERTALMGDLAHEVGNLANVSRTAVALRDEPSTGGTDYTELVGEYVEQLHGTTRAMLAHARLASAVADERPHAVTELAARAERLCRPLFARGDRAFRVVPPASDTHVVVDAVLLMQVALNLVSNAVKHSPAGGAVKLALSLGDGAFHLSVTDEGDGIPAGTLERLRARGARGVTRAEGHGIGLAVVDGFLARMGGRLEIESEASVGTTMRAVVPQPGDLPGA